MTALSEKGYQWFLCHAFRTLRSCIVLTPCECCFYSRLQVWDRQGCFECGAYLVSIVRMQHGTRAVMRSMLTFRDQFEFVHEGLKAILLPSRGVVHYGLW
jgi:hypothetical protein